MKNTIRKFEKRNKRRIHNIKFWKNCFLILILLFNVSVVDIYAQEPISFENNISLPSISLGDYSSAAADIITANDKIYVYTGDKMLVFEEDTQTNETVLTATIPFDEKYGKFNPVIFNEELYLSDINFMAVCINDDQTREDLYVVTPNLDILLINTDTDVITQEFNVSADIGHLKPLHGVCRLKYDDEHHRLYWLIKGRQIDEDPIYNQNCTGHFHYREIYFAIYNVGSNGYINTTPYYVFNELTKTGGEFAHYRNINICDFEFNIDDNNGLSDYLFLAKYNKIEVWNVGNMALGAIKTYNVDSNIYGFLPPPNTLEPKYYKFSKLLRIQESGINKIVALPYRYPTYSLPTGKIPLIYVIDCFNNSPSATAETINSPNQRVFDAVFIPERKDLAICYSADPVNRVNNDASDMAFYRFNPGTGDWLNQINTLTTNSNPEPGKDIDSPTNFTKVNYTTLVSKKDEIISFAYSSQSSTYQTAPLSLVTGENNFFRKGTVDANDNKCMVLNTGGGKLEMFGFTTNSTSISHTNSFRSNYPVYHIAGKTTGTKQYYFNKLNIDNAGFFIYDSEQHTTINVNEDTDQNNDFVHSIGDCIYNPDKEEFLVSENEDFGVGTAAKIIRYNSDNNQKAGEIELKNPTTEVYFKNGKEMFIAPNEKLYVLVNTVVGDKISPNKPTILIFDAISYSFVNSFELPQFSSSDVINNSEFYMAHFCYSASNNTVYLTVTPQDVSLPPYNSEFNTMYNSENGYTPNRGYLYSIDDNNQLIQEYSSSIINPGRIVCPDDGNESTQTELEDYLFILSNQIITYNYTSKSVLFENKKINELVYSPYHDKLFGLANEVNPLNLGCQYDRVSVVYEITKTPSIGFTFTQKHLELGQSASFFLNHYNNKLYLHTKFDNEKLGVTPSQLIEIDVPLGTGNAVVETVELWNNNGNEQNTSFYPELDHNSDFNYFAYNLTTSYIDPIHNKIYLPNGWHSNVSVVSMNYEELDLLSGITWLSFPRLLNNPGTSAPVQTVLGPFASGVGNILPQNFVSIDTNYYSYLENLVPNSNIGGEIEVEWDDDNVPPIWNVDYSQLKTINSLYGYKINLLPGEERTLHMQGVLEDANTEITLHSGEFKENWLGYFLYESQSPFDAIPSATLDLLSSIKGQGWYCSKQWNYPHDGNPVEFWVCAVHEGDVTMDYGDMVILKTTSEVPGSTTFQWQNTGNKSSLIDKPETEYYQFTEQMDYTSFIIELDSTYNPLEIAAFIGDSCVGASTVLSNDTLVLIPGYTEGISGDVVFEEYYGSQKSSRPEIYEYFVSYNKTGLWKKRTINTEENQDHYFVSFKTKKEEVEINNEPWVNIFPNPVNNTLTINYSIEEKAMVNISIFDSFGRQITTLLSSTRDIGFNTLKWNLNGSNGGRLNNGIYIIKLQIDNKIISKKVVIN